MPSFARFGNDLYTGKRSFPIIARRRLWFAIALTLMALSLLILGVRGLNPGIEFRGGSEFTLSGVTNTSGDPAREVLTAEGVTEAPRITTVGGSTLRVQTTELDSDQIAAVRAGLAEAYDIGTEAVTSTYIGPSWGADVTQKALQGLVLFLVLVSLVMAAYFRTWKMAVAAVAALLHDLVITVGLYALIGFEITPASVIGFLTILGYSLYDTVVVFDKVRENTARLQDQDRVTYAEAANLAVNQTLVRSINTSVVGVLPVASILFVGVLLLGAGSAARHRPRAVHRHDRLHDLLDLHRHPAPRGTPYPGVGAGRPQRTRGAQPGGARRAGRGHERPHGGQRARHHSHPRGPPGPVGPAQTEEEGSTMTHPLTDLAEIVQANIREIPDYPSPGVLFRDITPLLANGAAFGALIDALAEHYEGRVDAVAGLESRGFILAAPLALHLGVGMITVRKAGKLPGPVIGVDYALEYGTARMELRPDTIHAGQRVLVIDDVLATGGTARASVDLVERAGGEVIGLAMLMELLELNGRSRLEGYDVESVLAY